MKIQEIINEADILVPNAVSIENKVSWINSISYDFFNVVKIPKTITFNAIAGQSDYTINGLLEKDIDRISVGLFWYSKLNYDNITTTENFFSYEDGVLSLYPPAYANTKGMIRTRRFNTTVFTTSNLNETPIVPEEFQWTLIPALASYLANTEDDGIKSANYENQYKAAWNVASQNFQVEGGVE